MLSYAIFFATYLYAIGFIGGFGVPTTLDGEPTAPLATASILVAIQLEERNLVDEFGESYREYGRRVPMLDPFGGKRREQGAVQGAARTA